MERIKIINVGPIKNIDLLLNKVNVIMGPQSSGKSTIAKAISYCQWVEKRYILDGEFKYSFAEQFLEFHRISANFFSSDSIIEYESDFVKLSYKGTKFTFSIRKKPKSRSYYKSKNIYIPAERNFVSVIPNLSRFKETNDNIMSFLYDWYDTKKTYRKGNELPILNLGVSYYHVENKDRDVVKLNSDQKEIQLQNASSGLQSLIPLTSIIDYLSFGFFKEKFATSVVENEEIRNLFMKSFYDIFRSNRIHEFHLATANKEEIKLTEKELNKITNLIVARSQYHFSRFIIEEPEQNLYPETQRDFVYFFLDKILNLGRDHRAFLTTHSPFILYALNNCMMGFRVKSEFEGGEKLASFSAWIDPNLVSVWEIDTKNGTLKDIKDPDTGTLSKNYFNQFTNELLDEYYKMLSHLDI